MRSFALIAIVVVLSTGTVVRSQTRAYPDKIRGYKVERTVVEVKRTGSKAVNTNGQNSQSTSYDSSVDQLISFGKPTLARVTPLGITFEVPMVVAPVTQSGKVEFLVFEDIEINGHPVNISEYEHSFSLPNS